MKPLQLEITAFGPFADTAEVDFSNLPTDRPFLIGGPTGAGKSSILDAMTYALYGKLPEDVRPRTNLRSDHADGASECRVTLVFEARGSRYRVTRTPKQLRVGVRSTEPKMKDPTARLDIWRTGDWHPVESGILAIDKRMIDTVGLTMEQFSKVAVLPQGRFERVLNAATNERVELLRTLFGSEVYRSAVARLEARRKALRQDVVRLATTVGTQRSGALTRIEALASKLVNDRPAIGNADPSCANVINLATRSDRSEFVVGVTDDELRVLVADLRDVGVAELVARRDRAVDQSESAGERLAAAKSRASLIAERDAHLEQRATLDSDDGERERRDGLLEAHRLAKPAHELLERTEAARETAQIHRSTALSLLSRVEPVLADPVLGFPASLRQPFEDVLAVQSIGDDDVTPLRSAADSLENHARRVATELKLLATESEAAAPLEATREQLEDERESIHSQSTALAEDRSGLVDTRSAFDSERAEKRHAAGELDELERNLRDAAASLEARRNLEATTSALSGFHRRVAELAEAIGILGSEASAVSAMIQPCRDTADEEPQLGRRVEQIDRLIAASARRDELLASTKVTGNALEDAESSLDAAMVGFAAGSAAVLAISLADGEPCPVCGSHEHPSPASPDSGPSGVSAADVDTARLATEAARRAHDEARLAVTTLVEDNPGLREADAHLLAQELATLRIELEKARAAGIEAASHQARIDELADELTAVRGQHTQAELDASRLQGAFDEATTLLGDCATASVAELETTHSATAAEYETAKRAAESVVLLDAEIDRVDALLLESRNRAAELHTRREVLASELGSIRDSIQEVTVKVVGRVGHADPREVATAGLQTAQVASKLRDVLSDLAGATRLVASLESESVAALAEAGFADAVAVRAAILASDDVGDHQDWIDEWRRRDAVNRDGLVRLAAHDLPDEAEDITALETCARNASTLARSLADLCASATAELHGIMDTIDAAAAGESGGEAAAEQLQLLEEVHGVLSGNRTSKRLAIEAWVLSSYLCEVAEAANVHLRSMTGGRFSLEVDSSSVVGTAKTGLDLAVVDADTGRSRPTQTLSGGETFQASLALALGFADVLTAGAAGLRIDALFVDEGFGTLDADSVDTVIEVLDGLRSRGAMVGLISHVEAMKEALPVALEVTKRADHRGSELRQAVLV